MKFFDKFLFAFVFAALSLAYSAFALPSITSYDTPTLEVNATSAVNWTYINITASEDLNLSRLEWGNSSGFTNVTMSNNTLTNWYVNISSLVDATYNYTIWMQNATGNWNQSERRWVTVDTAAPYNISACQDLTVENGSYIMTRNVSSAGTCFTIKANNITLNGNGYTINYSKSSIGYAVNNTGYNYTTIKNFNIVQQNSSSEGPYAINLKSSLYITILNNNITTTGRTTMGISIERSNSSNITLNRITTSGDNSRSIYLSLANSNTIYNNTITTMTDNGVEAYAGINNTVVSNTINATGSYGMGILFQVSVSNVIANNTVILSGSNGFGIEFINSTSNNIMNNNVTSTGGYEKGIYFYTSSYLNNVTNNTITSSGSSSRAIELNEFNSGTASNNTIAVSGASGYGIVIFSSSAAVVLNNTIATSGDYGYGIYMMSSTNQNALTDNTITTSGGEGYGIYLESSGNTTLRGNRMSIGNASAIYIWGDESSEFNHTIDTTNTAQGLPIKYYFQNSSITLENITGFGEFIIANSTNVTMKNVTFNSSGILFGFVTNSTIENSNITTGSSGISLVYSDYITIENNTITTSGKRESNIYITGSDSNTLLNNTLTSTGGTGFSIYVDSLSPTNTLSRNTITSSGSSDTGVYIGSNACNIINNRINLTLTADLGAGISVGSYANNLSGNIITTSGDSDAGMSFTGISSENTISNNNISTFNASSYGFYLLGAATNTFSNNNITVFGINGAGVWIRLSSDSNRFTDNLITMLNASYGVYITSSSSNNITGGSIMAQQGTAYYLEDTGATNNFTNTNFNAVKKISFADTISRFNYQNDSLSNIWLNTNVSAISSINRTLVTWSASEMSWNDSNGTSGLTTSYDLTGLSANTVYRVINTSSSGTTTRTISTDPSGKLTRFAINLNGNTQINVTRTILDCMSLTEENHIYVLELSVSSNGTCFTIMANNITLDGGGYTINYSKTSTGYAINNTGGYNYTTIKNVNIVQGNASVSGAYAIYLNSSSNAIIENSNITSAYYLENAGATNNFTNTNFTELRNISLADSTSQFNYRDGSSSIWLKTNISAAGNISRIIVNWTNSTMRWNDTNYTANITANYTISGLLPSLGYNIYNTSNGTQTKSYIKVTDSSGNLPGFVILLNGNTELLLSTCTESWSYSAWSTCSSSSQSRTGTDDNNCGTTINRTLTQSCSSGSSSSSGGGGGSSSSSNKKTTHPKIIPPGLLKNTKLQAALEKVMAKGHMDQNAVNNLIRLSNEISGDANITRTIETGSKSNVTTKIKYTGTKAAKKYVIYENVSKSFANSSNKITVSAPGANIEVVETDPTYAIAYDTVNPNQELTITYSVNNAVPTNAVDSFSTEVYADSLVDATNAPSESTAEPGPPTSTSSQTPSETNGVNNNSNTNTNQTAAPAGSSSNALEYIILAMLVVIVVAYYYNQNKPKGRRA